MSFNVNELIKIRKATSGSEKSKKMLADYINQFKIKIDDLNGLDSNFKKKELVKLMNEESKKEKKLYQLEFHLTRIQIGLRHLPAKLGLIVSLGAT